MPNKNALISARIRTLREAGMTTQQALDAVLGEGTHAALANELYRLLREAQGLPVEQAGR